jgi:AcrR family transcriptional regulator
MSESTLVRSLRQGLNPRQAETVEKLLRAAEAALEAGGPRALTIRPVAQRAGVSPATAYTYLASKHHLFAELFWRAVTGSPPDAGGDSPVERVRAVTRNYAELLGRSPHLATAANMALLGTDQEVERLRLVIGAEFVNRFRDAIGPAADRRVLDALTFAFSGALLQTGMGLMTYDELSERLDDVVAAIMEGH